MQNLAKDEVFEKLIAYEQSNMDMMRSTSAPTDDMDVDDPTSE
jgi:hypothetical protein